MWPWGHLAVGYLCYVASIELRDRGEQTFLTLVAVAIGSQFPDLVDKPLAWTFAVLPSGRSLAHSLVTVTVVLAIGYWLARRVEREESIVAFGIGYVSHVLVDLGPGVVGGLLLGDMSQLQWTTYLLWPLLPAPPYPHDDSFYGHFAAFVMDWYVLVQFGLFAIAVGVWIFSGMPGLAEARQHGRRIWGHGARIWTTVWR